MYQQEKRKIIAEYLLSPRCYQSVRTKPTSQFSSWKNLLHPDITHLSNKINSAKYQYYQSPNRATPKQRRVQSEQLILDPSLANQKSQLTGYKNSYSNLEIGMSLPKAFPTHRQSRFSFTDKNSIRKFKNRKKSIEMKDQSSLKSHDKTLQSPNCVDLDLQIYQHEQEMPRLPSTSNLKQRLAKTNSISQYHLQLKEEERLYLLKALMEHYEKAHNLKL